ncbi:MAG: single-stranded-DNA-specific exonuclease RecJ [Armatimonadetes bacterium]|nr:single-stranded-DNA-specific exonuclease RecJ [Armatimonadota bacterium]
MPRRFVKSWHSSPRDPLLEAELSARVGIQPLAAAALVWAGVTDAAQARAYLSGSLDSLPPASQFRGMTEAVELVIEALADRRPVLVHGDYDADGICSTAILVRALHRIGATVHYYLPNRFRDDYGVSERAVRAAAGKGIDLILASDCGISAHDEISLARSLGCSVIVLDHHEPGPTLPEADVVVAPRVPDWSYECEEMPASALALRFVQALTAMLGDAPVRAEDLVDIAAIGIIADVAPMTGENRVIARAGLDRLNQSGKGREQLSPGIRALMGVAAVSPPVRAYDVAFRLAPRLNAVGRLADPIHALELLLTGNEDEARRLALHLEDNNRERQRIQEQIYREAVRMLGERPELLELPAIVLASPDWHVGVIGIVAAKLVEEYDRPAVLFGELPLGGGGGKVVGEARGSARSVEAIDIMEALRMCEEQLLEYGGHPQAAGLRIDAGRVEAFREAFVEAIRLLGRPDERKDEPAVIPASLDEVDVTLVADLARLEPFGPGNPEPVFAIDGLEVVEVRTVGRDEKHLKLYLTDGRRTVEAIGFGMAGWDDEPKQGGRIDLCFVPEVDKYWGPQQVQLRILGWRPTRK